MSSEATAVAAPVPESGSASEKPLTNSTIDSTAGSGNGSNAATEDQPRAPVTAVPASPAAEAAETTKLNVPDASKEPATTAVNDKGEEKPPAATAESVPEPTIGITSAVAAAVPGAPAQLPVPGSAVAPPLAPVTAQSGVTTNGTATSEAVVTKNGDTKSGNKRPAEEPPAGEGSDGPISRVKKAAKKAVEPIAKKLKTDNHEESTKPANGANGLQHSKSKREKKPAAAVGRTERKTRSQGPL